MIYVVDAHPLVWLLQGDSRLPSGAMAILRSGDCAVIVPSIVIAEIWHLFNRRRIRISPQDIRSRILSASNCSVYPLDETVLDLLPKGLDIHDAIIVATAQVCRDVLGQPAQLITGDRKITESGLIDVLW